MNWASNNVSCNKLVLKIVYSEFLIRMSTFINNQYISLKSRIKFLRILHLALNWSLIPMHRTSSYFLDCIMSRLWWLMNNEVIASNVNNSWYQITIWQLTVDWNIFVVLPCLFRNMMKNAVLMAQAIEFYYFSNITPITLHVLWIFCLLLSNVCIITHFVDRVKKTSN